MVNPFSRRGVDARGRERTRFGCFRIPGSRLQCWSHDVPSMVLPLPTPLDGQMRVFDGGKSAANGQKALTSDDLVVDDRAAGVLALRFGSGAVRRTPLAGLFDLFGNHLDQALARVTHARNQARMPREQLVEPAARILQRGDERR